MNDFQIQPGIRVALENQTVEIMAVTDLENVQVRNIATGRIGNVAIGGLSRLPDTTQQSLVDLTTLDAENLAQACRWRDAVVAMDKLGQPSIAEMNQKAAEMGCSVRTLYRRLHAHRKDPSIHAQVAAKPGVKPGTRLCSDQVEGIIAESVEAMWLTEQKATGKDVHVDVQRRCYHLGIDPPSLCTVRRRLREVDRRKAITRRHGRKAARDQLGPSTQSLAVQNAFDLLQIDHALVDIILVDQQIRRPIGRPWLTIAIDCRTRVIGGIHLGFEPPSSIAVAACIAHAWLQKDDWMKANGIQETWPVWGRWKTIHLDNAREFHGQALRAGCLANQVMIEYRPVATPHYGGHIERLIGTLSRKIRLLPGATFSSAKERGSYKSEERATLTFPEFQKWLGLEIAAYHRQPHQGLKGQTPLQAWRESLSTPSGLILPPIVADPHRFILDFLPFERRLVRRDGVCLFNTRYWSGALSDLAGSREPVLVKYDPRDMSRVNVQRPDGTYVTTPYADIRRRPISLAESRAVARYQKFANHDPRNEVIKFDVIDQQRAIEAEAASQSKRARRAIERRTIGLKQVEDLRRPHQLDESAYVTPLIDYDIAPPVLSIQEWD